MTTEPAGADIEDLVAELRVGEQGIFLDDETVTRFQSRFEAKDTTERKPLAVRLIALARKLPAADAALARPAVEQLLDLCAVLRVDRAAATAACSAVLGQEKNLTPVGTEKVQGAVSPLGARFMTTDSD